MQPTFAVTASGGVRWIFREFLLNISRYLDFPKGCTSGSKDVNTVAHGIGYSAATENGAPEHERALAAKFELEFRRKSPIELRSL